MCYDDSIVDTPIHYSASPSESYYYLVATTIHTGRKAP